MKRSSQGHGNVQWRSKPTRFVQVEGGGRKRPVGPLENLAFLAAHHQRHERKAAETKGKKTETAVTRNSGNFSSPGGRKATAIGSISAAGPDRTNNEGMANFLSYLDADYAMPAGLPPPARLLVCDAYPSDLPTEIVAPLFHLWNSIAAPILGSASGALRTMVARQFIANAGPFHAGLMTALDAQDIAEGPSGRQRRTAVKQLCHSIGIQQARILVAELNTNATQFAMDKMLSLLLMTLALATEATEEPLFFRQRRHEGPNQAPLRDLGMLNVWGSGYRFRNLHADALHRLLTLAGGLDALPSWTCVVPSTISLIVASQDMTKPIYSCLFNNEDFFEVFGHLRSIHANPHVARSFKANIVQALGPAPDLEHMLLNVIDDAQLCFEVTELFVEGNKTRLHESYLWDARKWVQYQTLILPELSSWSTDTWNRDQEHLYEIIRLTLNIYTLVAIFPLPAFTAPYDDLALSLLSEFEALQQEKAASEATIMMWACVVGALASTGTTRYKDFILYARRFSQPLQIGTWPGLQQFMHGTLWYPEVSDLDGKHFWYALQELPAGDLT